MHTDTTIRGDGIEMKPTNLVGTFNKADWDTLLKPIILETLHEDECVIVVDSNGNVEKIVGDKKKEVKK